MLFNILSYMSNELLGKGNTAASIDELYLFLTNMTAIEYIRNAMKTHAELIAAVNAAFGTDIDPEDFEKIMSFVNRQIVDVARSQIGNVGGEPYWSWYGFPSRVEWCACFVSWCADQCGYIDSGIIPRFSGCEQGAGWFKARNLWQDGSATPTSGAIIFFDWVENGTQDGSPDHVGIVEKVENGRVYTIEGNSGDACQQNSYPSALGMSIFCGQIAAQAPHFTQAAGRLSWGRASNCMATVMPPPENFTSL